MKRQVVRRSQAERKVALRQAVLTAAVSALHEHGYGATTTVMVAERAGISRGAMQNHFPTKSDLMTFVVAEVYEDELAEYDRILNGIDDPVERMRVYPYAAWQVLSRPSGVAVLEILMGSRSDRVLAEKLAPIQAQIQSSSLRKLENQLGRPPIQDVVRLVAWAIRGLSIENVLSGESGAEDSVRVLQLMIKHSFDAGLLTEENARSEQMRVANAEA